MTAQDGQEPKNGNNLLENGEQLHEGDLSEEEEFDDVADTFESVYNFRYEEP